MKKTVLITGDSSGFGKTAARHFVREDWNVIALRPTRFGGRPYSGN